METNPTDKTPDAVKQLAAQRAEHRKQEARETRNLRTAADVLGADYPAAHDAEQGAETDAPPLLMGRELVELRMRQARRSNAPAEDVPPFLLDGVHPCVVEAHAATMDWVSGIEACGTRRGHFLTLYGRSGCGKTHLMRLAAAELKRHGVERVQRWNWVKVLQRLHDGDYDLIGHLCRLDVLLLDDVGAEYNESRAAAAFSAARLYEILEARAGRWMMMTTNLSPNDIRDRLDARIASRFFRDGAQLVNMTAAADWSFQQWKRNNA